MLINYVPGEECRVAVVRDDKLEELHAERVDSASHVGNIYVGKVVNVEAGIQAAFVDFGLEHNGFLHITDLHPRYFPGEDGDSNEKVGKKTPRRDRPPIQACLKRGQEVIVQVLKEGIGTKGPTLTSYLSIPGRFLVMMPQMDNVGVSRRVEDEEHRRKMREILDQLDLPEGFGFILRTAGLNRTKTELKRDLAYLMRLWKDMQRRLSAGSKPRLLFAESDLLVRALRDVLTSEIDEIVIDDLSALKRASRFLKIVAPRAGQRLLRYNDPCPIFHAYGVEEQIQVIHAREAPLPSGGSIVIDEAEALVAIDVNSGKMRDNRDAETTAYKTNCEAVDEICRQLRLRDLGGVVICDLIDMRSRKHQRDIEQRFKDNLKRDRANTKTLSISAFGILEMTRQRMRGSHGSVHFASCPTCQGRGLVQRPHSVLAETLRELAWLLNVPKVRSVEVVLAPRIAGELLSAGRQRLSRLERQTNKHVSVRVSETAPPDHVSYYAYDEKRIDIDLEKLPRPKCPSGLEVWEEGVSKVDDWAADPVEEAAAIARAEAEAEADLQDHLEHLDEDDEDIDLDLQDVDPSELSADLDAGGAKKKRRRRRRRRGKGGAEGEAAQSGAAAPASSGGAPGREDSWDVEPPSGNHVAPSQGASVGDGLRGDSWDLEPAALPRRAPEPVSVSDEDDDDDAVVREAAPTEAVSGAAAPAKKKRRRRSKKGRGQGAGEAAEGAQDAPKAVAAPESAASEAIAEPKPAAKKKRSRGGKKKAAKSSEGSAGDAGDTGGVDASPEPAPEVVVKKARPRRKKKAASSKGGGEGGAS